MTPAEEKKLARIEAFEAAQQSIRASDGVINLAKAIEGRVERPWSREERVATLAKFLLDSGRDANPYAIYILAARAIDRLLEVGE